MSKAAIAALLVLGVARIASASSPTVKVGSTDVPAGGATEITVDLASATGLGCMEGLVRFDPSVLRVEEVQAGPLLDGALARWSTEKEGRVPFTFATTGSVKGEGTLLRVRFRAVGGAGKTSDLTLEDLRAWDDSSQQKELFVATEAGKATIVSVFPWLWVGGGTCVLVLLFMSRRLVARGRASISPATPSTARCGRCGASLRDASRFCDSCGAPRQFA